MIVHVKYFLVNSLTTKMTTTNASAGLEALSQPLIFPNNARPHIDILYNQLSFLCHSSFFIWSSSLLLCNCLSPFFFKFLLLHIARSTKTMKKRDSPSFEYHTDHGRTRNNLHFVEINS